MGSCVRHGLMKASHLKDGSGDGAKAECYQRDPNDLWELKHRCSLPLYELPLISHRSPRRALGYPSSEREKIEKNRYCTLTHPSQFSSGDLVLAQIAVETQTGRGWRKGVGGRWTHKKVEKKRERAHFALLFFFGATNQTAVR